MNFRLDLVLFLTLHAVALSCPRPAQIRNWKQVNPSVLGVSPRGGTQIQLPRLCGLTASWIDGWKRTLQSNPVVGVAVSPQQLPPILITCSATCDNLMMLKGVWINNANTAKLY